MTDMSTLNMDRTLELMMHIVGQVQGAAVTALMYLGDKLGLYRTMQGAGPLTSAQLAERTGLNERWVREWLNNQGAAGVLQHRGEGRFELEPEAAAVLADEEGSPFFLAGMFQGIPTAYGVLPQIADSFKTGIGLPFDAQGEEGAHGIARGFAPWYRHMLLPVALPSLDGVVPKLEAGAKVADVGCGTGTALITMAKAYPASEFHGYELSKHAIAIAEKNKAEAGVTNVEFHDVRGEALPSDGSFDFITTFDCIHDMTHPRDVMMAVRKALKDDGVYLIADINSKPTYEENTAENPMAALMYGFSVLSCMSSATSEPGGEGLGTLGFHPDLAREMTEAAGFTRFQQHDFGSPVNVYYEVRP
jgi:2-polyprenyl-3-methyl-5-hydroxy-6-metoxy-1,4-benzoquinol methylase